MIAFRDWEIKCDGLLGRQYDNLSRRLDVVGELPEGWDWAMLVQVNGAMDIIALEETEEGVGVLLTRDQLSFSGYYQMQLRGTQGDVVRHTNTISVLVPKSLSGDGQWPEVPSEFTQIEQRIVESNAHPPVPGENGYWLIWDLDLDQYEESQFPLPEGGSIGSDGGYYAPSVDEETGVLSWTASKEAMPAAPSANVRGPAGADGKTPEKGVDYWTAEDQAAIVNDVLAALPAWEGGSY